MAIKSGRVGVRHDQVDHYGRIKNVAGGIYSNLSAGSLVSSSSAESSNVNTPSSFTGKIDLTSIKGNTIKWNQNVESLSPGKWTYSGSTVTYADDIATVIFSTQYGLIRVSRASSKSVYRNGHKYLETVDIKLDNGTYSNLYLGICKYDGLNWGDTYNLTGVTSEWKTFARVFTGSNSNIDGELLSVGVVNSLTADEFTVSIRDVMLFDLTQMFGAGNEPTTVEQFKSMFPLDWYEYDTGSLLFFKADVLLNTLTGEQIYLPTLTYFPTGMKSAGTIYDELTPSKAITRIGAVDLGTLDWTYDSLIPRFYTMGIGALLKKPVDNIVEANAISSIYENTTFYKLYTTEKKNMTMALSTTGALSIINTSYSDVATFKTAMSGVMLYYELATPIETNIDVDFNLSLNVNEGENLQLLPLGTDTPASAPLRASVTSYKSGATGNDVEKLLGSIAQVETSPATSNHSVGDYIMYNYQLYKVTASITTGASLVVGTNITATTVMDEFLTL